jgi:hypothetical protein
MFTKQILRILLIAVIAFLAVGISPGSAEQLTLQKLTPTLGVSLTDMGTAFTYQGRLLSGSSPANGVYDFDFDLYDDISVGTLITHNLVSSGDDVTVTNGLFMVEIDFGPLSSVGLRDAFNGLERWIQIGVRDGGSLGAFTSLSPRQKLTPTPYATFARTIYRRTVVVKPLTPTGSATDNGKELLGALNDIIDASADNRYLLKIEPGIYDIDTDSLGLVEYVDIEGSGEGVTIITGDGGDNPTVGTLTAKWNGEVRSLTIESTGINDNLDQFNYANAVYIPPGITLKLLHVSLIASDGLIATRGICNDGEIFDESSKGAIADLDSVSIEAYFNGGWGPTATPRVEGIYNDDTSFVRMIDSTVIAIGGAEAFGLDNMRGSAYIETSDIGVKGDSFNTYSGIRNIFSESSLTMRNSTINVSGESAGTAYLNGIENNDAGIVQLFDSTISASGNGTYAVGIRGGGEAPALLALNNVKVEVFGTNKYNYGVYYGNAPVTIRDSHIYASGGNKAIGLYFSDDLAAPNYEITQTVIKADGATPSEQIDPRGNNNFGVYIYGEGTFKFTRDTIWVAPQSQEQGIYDGGVGMLNNRGNVTFENGTINDRQDVAYMGIAHVYDAITNNQLWVNSSEVYTCNDSQCSTIYLVPIGALPPTPPVIWIGSSLLWGAPVAPPGSPFLRCMWVNDENYVGFGWPAMAGPGGGVVASYVCP